MDGERIPKERSSVALVIRTWTWSPDKILRDVFETGKVHFQAGTLGSPEGEESLGVWVSRTPNFEG